MVTLTKVGYSFTVGPLVVRLKRRASGDTAETEEWRGEAAEGRSTLLVPRLPRGEYTLELREPSNAAPPPRLPVGRVDGAVAIDEFMPNRASTRVKNGRLICHGIGMVGAID